MIRIEKAFASAWRSLIALAVVAALTALSAISAPTSATASCQHSLPCNTRFVSAAAGSDSANNCLEQYSPCATIQHAIDEAETGDDVYVRAGIYTEDLTIAKQLWLTGPNQDLEHRESEANIDGGGGVAITAEAKNIEIDGFTISSSGAGIPIRTAGANVDGLTVHSNIITSDTTGLNLEAGGEKTAISLNQIEAKEYGISLVGAEYTSLEIRYNRLRGPANFYGVFAEGSTAINGFRMEGNEFGAARIDVPVTEGLIWGNKIEPPSGGIGLQVDVSQTQVWQNTFRGNGKASCLRILGSSGGLPGSTNSSVDDNDFVECSPYGVQLGAGVEAIRVEGNRFPGSYDGVVTDASSPWDVTGSGIKVAGNRMVELADLGVSNPAGGTLDAQNNWWGCNAGPGHADCDGVGPGVDASPTVVLTAEASEDPEEAAGSARVTSLNPGEEAVIIAYLRNDDGYGTEALNVPTEGTPASFSSSSGVLAPVSATWQNARAESGFTAGAQPGPAGILVGMDNQQIEVPLTIAGPSPSNASPPSILGEARQGQTLTEQHGSWANNPTSYAYQWQRCDSMGNSCSAIVGAIGQSYVVTQEDLGHTIRVQESATNISGTSDPAISASTGVVQEPQSAAGRARIGRAKARGITATVQVRCIGPSGTSCTVALSMHATRALKGPQLVVHSASRRAPQNRAAVVGKKVVRLAAGDRRVVRVKLNGAGRRLLATRGVLHAILEGVQIANHTTTRVTKQMLTFSVAGKD